MTPIDESADDAALRREMLMYGAEDIGPIVAELELEEDGSFDEDDEILDLSGEEFDDEGTDEEDEFGRTKRRVVTEDYMQRMLELEKKLGVKSRFTKQAEAREQEAIEGGIGKIVVNQELKSSIKEVPAKDAKAQDSEGAAPKSVRFAEELNTAPDSSGTVAAKETEAPVNPIGDVH